MEGGQSTDINLRAGLDVNTSDMLVPLSDVTFQHNWQKYQGKFLPNSLRFEKNGWAAGWNVFNFNYDTYRARTGDKYAELSQFNNWTQIVALYSDEADPDADVVAYVIPDSFIQNGTVTLTDNTVTGNVNGRQYQITWDENTKSFTDITQGFSVEQTVNSDYSVQVKVIDDTSVFSWDVNLWLGNNLTCDELISEAIYHGYEDGKHTWGMYSYDNSQVTTPEGIVLTPTITDNNKMVFDYEVPYSDDSFSGNYTVENWYLRFSDIKMQNGDYETLLLADGLDTELAFNYMAPVASNSSIVAKAGATVIDWKLPLWLEWGASIDVSTVTAKKCDNTQNNEILINTYNTLDKATVYVLNAFEETVSELTLTKSGIGYWPKPQYRFNKIQPGQTIEWKVKTASSRYKYNIASKVYFGNTKGYNNIRSDNTESLVKALGTGYSITPYFNPQTTLKQNSFWDDTNPDDPLYTEAIVSEISSIILQSDTPSSAFVHDDLEFVAQALPDPTDKYNFAEFTGSLLSPEKKTLSELYDSNGNYIGGTYTQYTGSDDNMPLEYLPYMWYDDGSDTGVYCHWTDGTEFITDPDIFVRRFFGVYSEQSNYQNEILSLNSSYSRTRVVKNYTPFYDFDAGNSTNETLRANFRTAWAKYYPSVECPLTRFDDSSIALDIYSAYDDIEEVNDQTVRYKFTAPGVYIKNNWAVQFNSASGLVLYDGSPRIKSYIKHHGVDVTSQYNVDLISSDAYVIIGGAHVSCPGFFGESGYETVVKGSSSTSKWQPSTNTYERITGGAQFLVNFKRNGDQYGNRWVEPDSSAVKSSNWLKYYAGSIGNVTQGYEVRNYTGIEYNTSVDTVNSGYSIASISSGIRCSTPVWGHGLYKITMPDIVQGNSSDTILTCEKVTSNLPNTHYIYWDRSNTEKSMYLWDMVLGDINTSTGSIPFTLSGTGKLYGATEEITDDVYTLGTSLKAVESLPALTISTTPVIKGLPNGVVTNFTASHAASTGHKFYNNLSSWSVYLVTDPLTDYNATNDTLSMTFIINNEEVPVLYLPESGATILDESSTVPTLYNESDAKVDVLLVTGLAQSVDITLDITLKFNDVMARFYKLSDGYTLGDSVSDTISITKDNVTLVYSKSQNDIVSGTLDSLSISDISNGKRIIAAGRQWDTFTGVFASVYGGDLQGDFITIDGYVVDYKDLKENSTDTGISVLSTNITEPDKTKTIGKIKPNGQYQLLKQQWDSTTATENFWWIDSKHVLCLTKDSFILRRNTKTPDDWNGDIFEDVYVIPRTDLLDSNTIRYYTTNVYNSSRGALFFTIQETTDGMLVKFYKTRPVMKHSFDIVLKVRQHDIGTRLNDMTFDESVAYLNTYSPLTVSTILSKAIWSSTIVGDYLVLGVHYSNNFDQWAIVIDLNSGLVTSVLQGYGYVGLHGDLTGGMLPDKYMSETVGFNDTVQPLNVLKPIATVDLNDLDKAYNITNIEDINKIEDKVVGVAERQWYISQKLFGIVSHLTFNSDTGTFTKQCIPMTNNYTAVYKSPSFGSFILADTFIQATMFSTIVQFESGSAAEKAWNIFMGLMGVPTLYYLKPRLSSLLYLQQTMGQYAYVHYNSSLNPVEKDPEASPVDHGMSEERNLQTDPVLSSDYVFDKQKVTQNIELTGDIWTMGILSTLMAAFSAAIDLVEVKTSINEAQNQTSTTDFGKRFADVTVENVDNFIVGQLKTQSKGEAAGTSSVTALKSLDMFYSTSDQQSIHAGPGFCEHQYVADCVAQSVTDLKVKGQVFSLMFVIRALTTVQYRMIVLAETYVAEGLSNAANGMLGNSNPFVNAAGVAAKVAAAAMQAHLALITAFITEVDKIMDALCANGITSQVEAGVPDRESLTTEGKHKYGEKSETFMWPCWGIQSGSLKYTDEEVKSGVKETKWTLSQQAAKYYIVNPYWGVTHKVIKLSIPSTSSVNVSKGSIHALSKDMDYVVGQHKGKVPFYQAACYGQSTERTLPDDMAKVEGVNKILPDQAFKNENISVSEPAFTPSLFQDYIIDKSWDLSQCCTYGMTLWTTVKDTKIMDCPPSNMVVNSDFCGVACPYTAIEVKRGISKKYMRPHAITPNVLALNCTGYNSIFDNKLYHAFDGVSYRLVDLVGGPGLGKNRQTFWYAFQKNDRFKRSNKFPANELQGNFTGEPVNAVDSIDELYTIMTIASKQKGLEGGTIGEDKDATRWSLPIFTEPVSTLPAAVKTLTAMPLQVHDGVTALTVDMTNNQTAYKAPISVDFTIGKQAYRVTQDYICSISTENGLDILTELVPILGLKYIGATPSAAYFYSKSTRCYYMFSGNSLVKVNMMERFRDIQRGFWDFVNQEIVMPCLMTFKRLNAEVEDKDTETDNIIVPVLSNSDVSGELPPPLTTIFNDRSWYKCVSLPCGFAYQGPNRVIINRAIFCEYMERSIKDNLGKWSKMDKEKYVTHREYPEKYSDVLTEVTGVDGWTYNPFLLVTSPLGLSEDTDCMFEWTITFCWPIEMDLLYGTDNFACVNITAETMTPGGKLTDRPTHVYLTKELFTRTGNYGYYTFRYQSKNGSGNRERLHIWSDQYIAISSLTCEVKSITNRRTSQLTQQVDIQRLKEL